MKNKKGISPIIATVLLISIAIALFVVIYLWISGFQGERISKFGAPIENSCQNIYLQLDYIGGQLQIENDGSVPVYKIEIFDVQGGSTSKLSDEIIELGVGAETWVDVYSCQEQLKVVPVLLGQDESGNEKEYICENNAIVVSCY
jgi:flagellin-like protein